MESISSAPLLRLATCSGQIMFSTDMHARFAPQCLLNRSWAPSTRGPAWREGLRKSTPRWSNPTSFVNDSASILGCSFVDSAFSVSFVAVLFHLRARPHSSGISGVSARSPHRGLADLFHRYALFWLGFEQGKNMHGRQSTAFYPFARLDYTLVTPRRSSVFRSLKNH